MRPILTLAAALLMLPLALADALPVAPILVEVNPQGEWLELANPTTVDLDLAGWSVTDHDACFGGAPPPVALAGVTIPAGARALVLLSERTTCMRLADRADDIALLAPDGWTLQTIAWGPGADAEPAFGQSIAACALVGGLHAEWRAAAPTPRGANAPCLQATGGAGLPTGR